MKNPRVHRWLPSLLLFIGEYVSAADVLSVPGAPDGRIRSVEYSGEQVYRLYGFVGYQIDLQFDSGEAFVGLASGDIDGIAFVAEANHLFLKPKAPRVNTNLTILTNKRHYQFDYIANAERPDANGPTVIYALRFRYPNSHDAVEQGARTERALAESAFSRPQNTDYWFCGHRSLKPEAASDDGVHTRLRFGGKAEQPAIFVRNDDASESLLNFSMESGAVVIHRVARQFIVRRGKLTGCIVNKGFSGSGERLDSNTVSRDVERATRDGSP